MDRGEVKNDSGEVEEESGEVGEERGRSEGGQVKSGGV